MFKVLPTKTELYHDAADPHSSYAEGIISTAFSPYSSGPACGFRLPDETELHAYAVAYL